MKTYPVERTEEELSELCRRQGLKATPQRLAIVRELMGTKEHPDAETLYARVRQQIPDLSLDTVYRTLATFERLGLVHRLETTGSQARYEALTSPHHHFLCDRCGKVIDFSWQDFDTLAPPPPPAGAERVERTSVVLHGQCADCAQAAAEAEQG